MTKFIDFDAMDFEQPYLKWAAVAFHAMDWMTRYPGGGARLRAAADKLKRGVVCPYPRWNARVMYERFNLTYG